MSRSQTFVRNQPRSTRRSAAAAFAAVADVGDYHVFLTPSDDHDLRVSEQGPAGFTVRAKDPAASGRFSWRLVARRKDIAGARFDKVAIPPEPALPRPESAADEAR
jgi:hypothetical protein